MATKEQFDFAKSEYDAIATNTSQAFQTMALLVSIYFVFNGVLLSSLFALLASVWGGQQATQMSRFEITSIVVIGSFIVSVVFTIWSYYFVMSFGKSMRLALKRGADIENVMYAASSEFGNSGFFAAMSGWVAGSRYRNKLGLWSIIIFCLIGFFWILILAAEIYRVRLYEWF